MDGQLIYICLIVNNRLPETASDNGFDANLSVIALTCLHFQIKNILRTQTYSWNKTDKTDGAWNQLHQASQLAFYVNIKTCKKYIMPNPFNKCLSPEERSCEKQNWNNLITSAVEVINYQQ